MEEDCLGCRLASGGALVAASAYIYSHASTKSKSSKIPMYFVAAGNDKEFSFEKYNQVYSFPT